MTEALSGKIQKKSSKKGRKPEINYFSGSEERCPLKTKNKPKCNVKAAYLYDGVWYCLTHLKIIYGSDPIGEIVYKNPPPATYDNLLQYEKYSRKRVRRIKS